MTSGVMIKIGYREYNDLIRQRDELLKENKALKAEIEILTAPSDEPKNEVKVETTVETVVETKTETKKETKKGGKS